jgi:hypothetical protein
VGWAKNVSEAAFKFLKTIGFHEIISKLISRLQLRKFVLCENCKDRHGVKNLKTASKRLWPNHGK